MAKVVLITGGTSGIGLAAGRFLAESGCVVYELSRHPDGTDSRLHHIQADITDEAQIQQAVQEILRQEGRIDVLLNNAGFGISGAVEFTETDDAKHQFDVNFFGMVRMNKAVIPIMRKQGSGRIISMSSMAAPIAIPFQTYYSASKAAIRTYMLALAPEIRPFGIETCTIMPGDIQTGFTSARKKNPVGDDIYDGRISRSVAVMEHDELNGITSEAAGAFVARKVLQRHVPLLCTLGGKYKIFVFLTRIVPTRLMTWIVSRIYAK